MKRETTNPRLDHKVFKNTANTIKAINVKRKPMRGGIRL